MRIHYPRTPHLPFEPLKSELRAHGLDEDVAYRCWAEARCRISTRDTELASLDEGLSAVDIPVVLLGDFNDGTPLPAEILGLADAWTDVHGSAGQTPTFDPAANPLAAVSSLTGHASRLDRVLASGPRPHPRRRPSRACLRSLRRRGRAARGQGRCLR